MNDFDELRRERCLIEKEHEKKAIPIMAIGAEKESEKNEMQELKGMLQQLTAKVNKLEGQQQHKDQGKQQQGASSNYSEEQIQDSTTAEATQEDVVVIEAMEDRTI